MYNNVISENEKRSILFYQGGTRNIILQESERHLKSFYEIDNAYEVINTLLFSGIENERVRISEENRKLNPILLDNMAELLKEYCNIYSAMCKYTYWENNNDDYYLYRKDRMNTLQFLENGYTTCFFSTSFTREIKEYFHQKAGLLLLELEVPSTVEHLNVNEVLGDLSIHPDEEEILLSPFLCLHKESMELTKEETLFKDKNGEKPKAKYKIYIKGSSVYEKPMTVYNFVLSERLYKKIINTQAIENAKLLWKDLEQGNQLNLGMVTEYKEWKENIQNYLKIQFADIKAEIRYRKKWRKFERELDDFLDYTNRKRVEYDDKFTKINLVISWLQPLSALFLALSFIDEGGIWGTAAKIISLIVSTGCIILSGITKSLALEGKCHQRTKTYLRLDELRRDFRYEDDKSLGRLNKYIEEFKQIIKDDDDCCIENINGTLAHFQQLQNDSNNNTGI